MLESELPRPGLSQAPTAPDGTTSLAQDVEASWVPWAQLAADAGEHAVAERAWAAAPADTHAAAGRARALILLGRAAEVTPLVRPDVPGTAPTWPGTLHDAARAAAGDDDAWRRLLVTAAAESLPPATASAPSAAAALTEVIGAVATARDAHAIARRAAAEVVLRHGVLTVRSATALTAADLVGRDRHDSPDAILLTMSRAMVPFLALRPGPDVDPSPVLESARRVAASGDRAGARLLLRAAASQVRDSAAFGGGDSAPRRSPLLVGGALAALAAVIAGTATATGRQSWLIILAGVAAALLWDRLVPLPGFTRSETRAWRLLPSRRFEPDRMRAERDTYLVPACGLILGLMIGFIAYSALLAGPLADRSWTEQPAGDAVGWSITATCAGTGWLAGRLAQRGGLRRRARAERAARDRAEAADLADCRCWQDGTALISESARAYATAHLIPFALGAVPDLVLDAFGADASLAKCPLTGQLWLVGPIGEGGRWLALHGRAVEDDPEDVGGGHGYL